jgi:Stress responsive A/B Barrel Domain
MLTHVVCFKFDATDVAEEAAQRLRSMAGKIPGLLSIEAGVDVVHSARSYDVALITKFNDLSGLDSYQVHPVHVEVAAYIKAHSKGAVAVDFVS